MSAEFAKCAAVANSALISKCGRYRHRLDRYVQPDGIVILFIGVNPSTADGSIDDATTKKWMGFARKFGAGRYIAVNVFDYRATDVRELGRVEWPVSEWNASHFAQAVKEADLIIPCWGNIGKVPPRLQFAFAHTELQLAASNKPVKAFGFTQSGNPKHPLMLGYDTELEDYFK